MNTSSSPGIPSRQDTLHHLLEQTDGSPPGSGLSKHQRMAVSPFFFLRGSASLFYADLASGVLKLPDALLEVPLTCIMGDCHVSNFGFLTEEGSHGDRVIFAPNDFDDACVGHAGWDLARFLTSLFLCATHCRARVAGDIPGEEDVSNKPVVSQIQTQRAARVFLKAYRDTCQSACEAPQHDSVIDHFNKDHILHRKLGRARERAAGGVLFSSKSSLAKSVDLKARPLGFRQRPDRLEPLTAEQEEAVRFAFAPYMDDAIIAVNARLNAGTGSRNLQRFYLLVGPGPYPVSEDALGSYHIVEVKQQRPAAPLAHFPDLSPINRLNPAHLTVSCQRRMQRAADLLLDEVHWQDSFWLVRSRHHARVGIDPEDICIGKRATERGGFEQYAAACGRALALTHARSHRRSTAFVAAMAAVLNEQGPALIDQSLHYALQVAEDQKWLAEKENC